MCCPGMSYWHYTNNHAGQGFECRSIPWTTWQRPEHKDCLTNVRAGSVKAFFRGNGTNVLKIAPETSIKLGLNDHLKRVIPRDLSDISPLERIACGGLSGAVGQVRGWRRLEMTAWLASSICLGICGHFHGWMSKNAGGAGPMALFAMEHHEM